MALQRKKQKTSPYFSRYQVKFRRRRQGKTDYKARRALVIQDKNKYATAKYRLIVRFTKRDIVAQVAYTTIQGDVIIAAAYSHELPEYGLKVGLTNYSAGYCVGLLIARRVLTKLGLAETYEGVDEVDGEDYRVEAEDGERRPFTCVLDAGLKRTSTGSKVFSVLKGALDGGLDIPHNQKRFVGYDPDAKEYDADTMRKYIFGGHVAEYMMEMEEEEPEKFQAHFKNYIDNEVEADEEAIEELYAGVHEKIRENPVLPKKDRAAPAKKGTTWPGKPRKLTYDERKQALKDRLAQLMEDA
eukprot:jgi/Ulvmu1/4126/UM019_0105.1